MKGESFGSRKQLLAEYEESLFRLVMHDVAEEEGRKFIAENDELKREHKEELSSQALARFEKLYKKNARRRKELPAIRTPRLFNRVAIILIVFIAVCLTSMVTVEAIRTRVLNFLIDVEKQYTSIHLGQKPKPTGGIPLDESWSGCYIPTYIPDGYLLTQETNSPTMKQLRFENNDGDSINYSQFDSSVDVNLDTENATLVEDIKVNDQEGFLVIKGNRTSIAWADKERLFTITTSLDRAEALLIAESVKILK